MLVLYSGRSGLILTDKLTAVNAEIWNLITYTDNN